MPHIPKLFCTSCGREMLPHETGVVLQVNASMGPYYKIAADIYKCPSCKTEVAAGMPRWPISEHFMEGFDEVNVDYVVRLNN